MMLVDFEDVDAGVIYILYLKTLKGRDAMRAIILISNGLHQPLVGHVALLHHFVDRYLVKLVVLDNDEHLEITHIPKLNGFLEQVPPPLALNIDPPGPVRDERRLLYFLIHFLIYMV